MFQQYFLVIHIHVYKCFEQNFYRVFLHCKKVASSNPQTEVSSSYGKQNYTYLCIF